MHALDPGRVLSLYSVVSARWSPGLGRNRIARPTCGCCPCLPHSQGLAVSPSAAFTRDSPWYHGLWLGTNKAQSEAGLFFFVARGLAWLLDFCTGWVSPCQCLCCAHLALLHRENFILSCTNPEGQHQYHGWDDVIVCGSFWPVHHGCECPRVCLNCSCPDCCRWKYPLIWLLLLLDLVL